MAGFSEAYASLNTAQRLAVDTIDGPLLVLAGPGTGKTQLLATRVANILQKTDALPQNILCLTFTESGAQAMRERLGGMIGAASYDVRISTYHSFGSEIIREYPEFFRSTNLETGEDTRLERPVDNLTKTQIIEQIIGGLSYDDALKSAKYYIKSVVDTVGECKKSLITPEELLALAQENLEQIMAITPEVQSVFPATARISKVTDAIKIFEHIQSTLEPYTAKKCLAQLASEQLESALTDARTTNKTTSITKWKNAWLTKNETGEWEFVGRETNEKIRSLARIYQLYQQALSKRSLYDFDDMILRTIEALRNHQDLLFNLQERYQYILLDEFQDTNAAQFELVRQLASHPVHEGRPNVMAVGDDDQAIYAFQGAEVGNMITYTNTFRDVLVVNLTQNYRSHHDIIHTAHGIAEQIESRLHHHIEGITKTLEAASTKLPANATIQRHEFSAQADEYAWTAQAISGLLQAGTSPDEIAVLSPKHARLESLVPFLNELAIPVNYEKRENILDTPIITTITLIFECIVAASKQQQALVDQLLPVILSLDFWHVPIEAIWRTNWQATSRTATKSWTELALENDNLRAPTLFLLKLGSQGSAMPLEYTFDFITGVLPTEIEPSTFYTSPLKEHYFSKNAEASSRTQYYEALSHLSVIRAKLREYQVGAENLLTAQDFTNFVGMYRTAEEPLINSHPIAQREKAVSLMTAYKAKGLEFEHVFLLSVHDSIWGSKSRSNNNKVGLPANLQHIRYFGSGEDELRRLLFVAITRAKHGLYLTSHTRTDTGKKNEPVKYLLEFEGAVGIFPENHKTVISNTFTSDASGHAVELLWHHSFQQLEPELQSLLRDRLSAYKMSPTHLNTYVDLERGGPDVFMHKTILRFPEAPSLDGEFGNAIHGVLEWYQKQLESGATPNHASVTSEFDRILAKRYIPKEVQEQYRQRGHRALSGYLLARKSMFTLAAKSEVDFAHESVVIGGIALLTGKIDRIEIDQAAKTIKIVDYKTGKPITDKRTVKYLRYSQQLYLYKLLVQGSKTYRGYTVVSGRLEFVEPDRNGIVAPPLEITYDPVIETDMVTLVQTVWRQIQSMQFADYSGYTKDYAGSVKFITDLIKSDQD